MTLSTSAADHRHRAYGIDAQDLARLPGVADAVRRYAPKALDQLYAMIAMDPQMSALLGGDSSVARARNRQADHRIFIQEFHELLAESLRTFSQGRDAAPDNLFRIAFVNHHDHLS